jgi:hypothetical protein
MKDADRLQLTAGGTLKRVRTFFLLSLVFVGCSTPPKKEEPQSPSEPTTHEVDYVGLKKQLGLNRPSTQLGFAEAQFDTCQQGYNLPTTSECAKNYFVVINFRLQCRHSTGTISQSLTSEDIEPVTSNNVKWNLKGVNGNTSTDSQGFGQVQAISPVSQKSQRLRLAVGTEFLYIRAGDISRVVAPGTWCD